MPAGCFSQTWGWSLNSEINHGHRQFFTASPCSCKKGPFQLFSPACRSGPPKPLTAPSFVRPPLTRAPSMLCAARSACATPCAWNSKGGWVLRVHHPKWKAPGSNVSHGGETPLFFASCHECIETRENGSGWKERWLKRMEKESTPFDFLEENAPGVPSEAS